MTEYSLGGFAAGLPYSGARPQPENEAAMRAAHEGHHTPGGIDASSMLSTAATAGDAMRPAGPGTAEMSPLKRKYRNRLLGGGAILTAIATAGALAWPAIAGNRGGGQTGGDTVAVSTTPPVDIDPTTAPPAYNLDDRCPDPTATEPETKTFGKRVKPPTYFPGDMGAELIDGAGANGLTFHEAEVQAYNRRLAAVEQKLNWVVGFADREKAERELQTILAGQGTGDDYSPYRGLTDVVLGCVFNHSMDPDRNYRIRLAAPDSDGVLRGKDDGLLGEGVVLDLFRMDGNEGTLTASYSIDFLELGGGDKDGRNALTIRPAYGLDKPLGVDRRD